MKVLVHIRSKKNYKSTRNYQKALMCQFNYNLSFLFNNIHICRISLVFLSDIPFGSAQPTNWCLADCIVFHSLFDQNNYLIRYMYVL